MSHVNCDICAKEISNGGDLVMVAHWGVIVRPYCVECYENGERNYRSHSRTGSIRLNSGRTTWGLATSLIAWAVVLTIIQGTESLWFLAIFGCAFVWMGVLRAYSYFKYERSLL